MNNTASNDILKSFKLGLPSTYIGISDDKFDKVYNKGLEKQAYLKDKRKNFSKDDTDLIAGLTLASYKPAKKGSQPSQKSSLLIEKYNIITIFMANMFNLRGMRNLIKGSGIIHFNNPRQLVSRLELLAGSIIAGNNGVKQEFSQIAHLLHQLKVISKQTLNDLLKKYILFK